MEQTETPKRHLVNYLLYSVNHCSNSCRCCGLRTLQYCCQNQAWAMDSIFHHWYNNTWLRRMVQTSSPSQQLILFYAEELWVHLLVSLAHLMRMHLEMIQALRYVKTWRPWRNLVVWKMCSKAYFCVCRRQAFWKMKHPSLVFFHFFFSWDLPSIMREKNNLVGLYAR